MQDVLLFTLGLALLISSVVLIVLTVISLGTTRCNMLERHNDVCATGSNHTTLPPYYRFLWTRHVWGDSYRKDMLAVVLRAASPPWSPGRS